MVFVIGMGIQGRASLLKRPLDIIGRAGLLVGGARHLAEFPESRARKVALGGLERAAGEVGRHIIKKRARPAVVLATGDPLIFGIGSFMIRKFGKTRVEIIPNVSTIQEAFARIKEDMNGLKLLSAHGREADYALIASEVRSNGKVAMFTDSVNTPARVCKELLARGVEGRTAFVCSSLGADESVVKGTVEAISRKRSFPPLSVLILMGQAAQAFSCACPGLPDEMFSHSGGMITKEELRVISLSKLELGRGSLLWDIGACSGSVAIEAARACGCRVYAIERDLKRVRDIRENLERFGCQGVAVVRGEAPAALKGLPAPDAVFVGGGGRAVAGVLAAVSRRLRPGGRVVVNAVTMETASAAFEFFGRKGWARELVLASISRTRAIGDLSMLSSHNPVFIIKGKKC